MSSAKRPSKAKTQVTGRKTAPAPKKAGVKKAGVKKAGVKKPVAKKPAAKKSAAKTTAGKGAASKRSAVKKPAAKRAVAKKSAVKKSPAKKTAAKKSPAKKPVAKKSTARPSPTSTPRALVPARRAGSGRVWLLDVPFEERVDAKWGGARFDGDLRRWVFRGEELPERLQRFAPARYSWESWLQDEANGGWQPSPGESSIRLHPHQEEAARLIAAAKRAGRRGFLLADEVGLGKTYATIAGVEALGDGLSVLVLCPLSVAPHWRRSIDAMGAGKNRWCVLNYDRMKNLLEVPEAAKSAKRTRTKNKRHVEQGESLVAWDVIVADESHLLKNPVSQRSKAMNRLASSKPGGSFVVWASATAGQNPVELAYLAPLLADLTKTRDSAFKDFEKWCSSQGIQVRKGAYGAIGWERNERDLELMREMLFSGAVPGGIRRRPTDIAGWPELERIAWPVELEPGAKKLYQEAWEEVREALVADTARRGRGEKPKNGDENPLVALLRFRQKASLLRAGATVEHTLDMLANGKQVAVSVEFLESAELIGEMLAKRKVRSVSITGAKSAAAREEARLEFQQGHAPVVIFTVREGISLHAGEQASQANEIDRVTIVHDPRWSAIATAQIEGRCVLEGERVQTARGAVPIEEVEVGDLVLTRTGELSPVEAVWNRKGVLYESGSRATSRRVVSTIKFEGHRGVSVTNDHQVWVRRGDRVSWIRAAEIIPGDMVGSPLIGGQDGMRYLRFPDEHRRWDRANRFGHQLCHCGTKAVARDLCGPHYRKLLKEHATNGTKPPKTDRGRAANPRYKPAPETILVDKAFLEFAGWYLAEGFAGIKPDGVGKLISLSGHSKECVVLEKHGRYLEQVFGLRWSISTSSGSKGIELRAWGADLATWFHADFGHMAPNKHLPPWFWHLSSEQQRIMLDSYLLGDGHRRTTRNGKAVRGWGTTSSRLHLELLVAFAGLGYKASGWSAAPREREYLSGRRRVIRAGSYYTGEFLESPDKDVTRGDGRWVWRRVSSVHHRGARRDERFFDLAVKGDPSFVVEGVTVHNCHRDGRNAVAYHAFGEGTVEEKVVRAVLARLSDMKTMIGDDTETLELLREMVER
jgi:hypothetical protein